MWSDRPDVERDATRRDFLARAGCGFGALALGALMDQDGLLAQERAAPDGLPHHRPRAKSVIWLFMEGGPSHLDLFDPKPMLDTLAGKPMPLSFGRPITAMGTANNTIMPSRRKWKRHGKSGLWVSDWYPHVAQHVDDLAVIRSLHADGLNHVGSVCQMNTGTILAGRPSLGAWTMYGIGSGNRNLPGFVIVTDGGQVNGAAKNWSSGFLPASYQGTMFRSQGAPIFHLNPPPGVRDRRQRSKLDLLSKLNRRYAEGKEGDTELEARIKSYELAYRMQSAAPEAVDFSKETKGTKRLYGMDDKETAAFGSNCLLARRLVERGVRFVQLYSGAGSRWDSHSNIEANHSRMCRSSDRPVAGLIADLKQRGMLDETLVIWGGEFGRTPFNEKGNGRDHNPWGFTMFLAGGGVKGGQAIGTTDEIGLRAQEKPYHVNDFHATILHLLGLDHLRLTFFHNARHERATVNGGRLIEGVTA